MLLDGPSATLSDISQGDSSAFAAASPGGAVPQSRTMAGGRRHDHSGRFVPPSTVAQGISGTGGEMLAHVQEVISGLAPILEQIPVCPPWVHHFVDDKVLSFIMQLPEAFACSELQMCCWVTAKAASGVKRFGLDVMR